MNRKQRRLVRHLKTVPGVFVNGEPYGADEPHDCSICSTGHVPGWRSYEGSVECVSAAEVSRRLGGRWTADEGARRVLGLS